MTLTADQIIKEAELTAKQNIEISLEKKASSVAEELIAARHKNDPIPVVKTATDEWDWRKDFIHTDKQKVKSFDKTAAVPAALTSFATNLFKGQAGQQAIKRIGIGAGIGAVSGALSNKDDRMGGAIKGALLGGAGGALTHGYQQLPGANASTKIKSFTNMIGATSPSSFKRVGGFTKQMVPVPNSVNPTNPNLVSGILSKQLNAGKPLV